MKKYFCVFSILFIFLVSCSSNSQLSNMPDETNVIETQNEKAHTAYRLAMEESSDNINRMRKNGKFENSYAYYDVDGDGIDELIVTGGYLAYM